MNLLAERVPGRVSRDWLEDLLDRSPAKILKALGSGAGGQVPGQDAPALRREPRPDIRRAGRRRPEAVAVFLADPSVHEHRGHLARLFKSVKNREQPFFGFFASEHLRPLPLPTLCELLRRIARNREQADLIAFLATPEGRSRVRAFTISRGETTGFTSSCPDSSRASRSTSWLGRSRKWPTS